ncbi:F-box/WD repeat-containing protein 8 isoform X2 [Clinocottus analis]|uniref:F-box/WD repeat-containing protein 8 isoform X2 n=1 Tax=Clinocottus analis TaxID=304258 RepID=UPI0035C25D42
MAEDELAAFRERWKDELTSNTEEQRLVGAPSPSSLDVPSQSGQRDLKNSYFRNFENLNEACSPSKPEEDEARGGGGGGGGGRGRGGEAAAESEDQPEYVSIARSLLDGRTSPLLDRIQEERTRRKRQYQNMTSVRSASLHQQQQAKSKVKKDEELLDQLIQDLNEVNDIPFFDIELPYELALQIFQGLNCTELGRCAQVSRAWRVLAEDGVLWFRMCMAEGYLQGASVADSPCWKSTLRDCRNSARTVRSNWKNRVGSISQLQFELGKVLCDVSCCDNFVLAGYTSGDVRLWDTLHWDSTASHLKINGLSANSEPRPHVSHVQVNSAVAAAAYEDGCVDLWSTETGGQPIHHYQSPGGIQALALSPDGAALASAAGPDVRLVGADDRGYWRTLGQARLPKTVESLVLVPGRGQQCPLAALAAGEAVHLLDPREERPRPLHSVYGHPVTCLDASAAHVAFGVKRTGWTTHDGGNKIHVYSLETGKPVACVGDSLGDFTCVNLRDGPPHLLVCGNKDRRHRGVICHYDFSEDALSQDHILPICRSDYIESSGYNYNIGLAVPYDKLPGSHPAR